MLQDRCPYDDAEFLNSVKNGKNAVLTAASQKGLGTTTVTVGAGGPPPLKSHGKPSNMATLDVSELSLTPPALKDVMKLIAIRKNIREENEASASTSDKSSGAGSGGKSRRTLGKWESRSFRFRGDLLASGVFLVLSLCFEC